MGEKEIKDSTHNAIELWRGQNTLQATPVLLITSGHALARYDHAPGPSVVHPPCLSTGHWTALTTRRLTATSLALDTVDRRTDQH